MQDQILEQLSKITEEEYQILEGNKAICKEIYAKPGDFIVDSAKILERGKLIDIRTHTRFAYFPKHRHNFIEIIYMCSGTTTHIINDTQEVILLSGELLFLNQNVYHEILAAKREDIAVNFIVLPEFFDAALGMLGEINILRDFIAGSLRAEKTIADYLHFKVADIFPVQNLMENMVWSMLNKRANERVLKQNTMGLLLLSLMSYIDTIESNSPSQYENKLVLSVLQSIEENYRETELSKIAGENGQSIYYLSRLIKRETGCTYRELLRKKRFYKAAELLRETRLSVSEIIWTVGYDNTSFFYRTFRKIYGLTPHQYRSADRTIGREKPIT